MLRAQLVAARRPDLMDARKQVAESNHAVTWLGRKIGAGKERRVAGRVEKDGQRPAAATAREQLVSKLIDVIEVRALLAVDLDVDEVGVHALGDLVVVEALARHHMAPVAGAVA